MIDAYRVDGYCVTTPYRVKVGGKVVLNKKGEPKKFHTMMAAISYGQRLAEKKNNGK